MEIANPHADFPTADWKEAVPQEVGIDGAQLSRMHTYIKERVPGLHALLIIRHSFLVFEQYYQGFHRNSYHSISSVTKSIISALVGIALSQGLLKDLDQRMLDFFPEYAAREHDPRKQAITLHHLLCFKTGFSREMSDQVWLNPVNLSLERPMERMPGEQFFYDELSADILSAILTRITGKSAAAFANETLFKWLGIWREEMARFTWRNDPHGAHTWHEHASWDEQEGYIWKVAPQGYSRGGFGAHLTAREMAKLGYLYLNEGYWDGTQAIPADYVAASTRQQSEGGWPIIGAQYGYLWWIEKQGNYHAFFAYGYGGKLIYVVPALDIIVVTAASTQRAKTDKQQWKEIKALLPRFVLPAILGSH